MRRRSFRVSLATLLVLGGCAAALAHVSGSKAGAVTGAQFHIFAQPPALTVKGTGFVKAVFMAPSGAGTGSATHVSIKIDLPSALAFNQSGSSSGCSIPTGSASVICTVGTVNAGVTVTRFVTFTAPDAVPTPADQPIMGTVSWDNGTGGNGGGGGSANLMTDTAQTTIYKSADTSHAGNCFLSGSGTVSTAPVSSKDNQATSAQVGAAAPSLGLPCTFAEVGEDHVAGFDTDISHDTIPQLSQPAKITLTLNSLPVKFEVFFWRFLPDYPDTQLQLPIPSCDDNGQLPTNEPVCLLSSAKKGSGGTWTFLQRGTDGDPAYGH